MKAITQRQSEVLAFIASREKVIVSGPTLRDCANHFEVNYSAVQRHILALRKKGFLQPEHGNGLTRTSAQPNTNAAKTKHYPVSTPTPSRQPIPKPNGKL